MKLILHKAIIVFLIVFLCSLFTLPLSAQDPSFAQIRLQPSKNNAFPGDTFTVTIQVTSGNAQVNAVQINLSYPESKLTLVETDFDNSDFKIQAPQTNSNGIVTIARGNITPLSGTSTVASLIFEAKQQVSATEILIQTDSVVMSSDNQNILLGSVVETVPENATAHQDTHNTIVAEYPESDPIPSENITETDSLVFKVAEMNYAFWEKVRSFFDRIKFF